MTTMNLTLIAAAVALCCGTAAIAQNMPKAEVKAGKAAIEADYKTAKTGCDSLLGNPKEICLAEAKGKEKVALAELVQPNGPKNKAAYNVAIAKADAAYSVARLKCNEQTGNAKDVCVKEAKAAEIESKASAKAQMKTVNAKHDAREKGQVARDDANKKIVAANKDAAADKTNAEYAVAKEKCDAFIGDAKVLCLNEAKTRFGK